jgi:hypothetical protein
MHQILNQISKALQWARNAKKLCCAKVCKAFARFASGLNFAMEYVMCQQIKEPIIVITSY